MTGIEGALRSSLRDELEVVGFVPIASKLYRPSLGLVPRSALVEQVRARLGDLVTVTAPAGYGKSTFLAQLADADPRPTAWVSLTRAENDPAGLLTYIALALDPIEPVDPRYVTALFGRPPTIGSPELAHFLAMLADRRRPFVLVLDDVHELVGRDVLDTLPGLIGELPTGSSILLGARTSVPLRLGRLRVRRRLVEVGLSDLAFDEAEAAALFRALDIDTGPADTVRLVERTEGWPVALYLAALAGATGRRTMADVVDDFAGDQRYVVEYLGEELLGGLDPDMETFLIEASCCERLSGDLCDEVLDRHGSADFLEDLRRRNLLVLPLDDRREWYRFHHLLTEFLQAELTRRDPARRTAIHLRASEWCDERGDGHGAVTHAAYGGDLDRMESMVMRWYGRVATAPRLFPTAARWVDLVPEDELLHRPLLMVVAAWSRFGAGQPGPALQWLSRATESLLPNLHPRDAQGPVPPVALAVTNAVVAPLTPEEMLEEATYAYERVGLGVGHPMACVARGAAAFMLGDEAEAVRRLREGADSTLRHAIPAALCLAHLAVIHVEHGRWPEATAMARAAGEQLGEIATAPYSVLPLAVTVLVETHTGRGDEVERERLLCRQHLTGLVGVAPWLNLQARVALARVAVLRGDRVDAAALLDEAAVILEATPSAVGVSRQVAGLRREVATRDRTQTFGPSSLTTAEQRVLQLLPTHLSIAEIADRLYVSRNTVKSQTIAIYRKLGVSSRTAAVEIATVVGLLHDARRD